MGQDIVCMQNVVRYYQKNVELMEKYGQIAKSGKCPFCPDAIANKFVSETNHWNVVFNQFPYKDTDLHLLILPKRHITSLDHMSPHEWLDLGVAIDHIAVRYPAAPYGCGLALRVGEIGGVTLYHLHFHLIVPKIGKNGQIPVNFGIG